jgi:hypothetical protein
MPPTPDSWCLSSGVWDGRARERPVPPPSGQQCCMTENEAPFIGRAQQDASPPSTIAQNFSHLSKVLSQWPELFANHFRRPYMLGACLLHLVTRKLPAFAFFNGRSKFLFVEEEGYGDQSRGFFTPTLGCSRSQLRPSYWLAPL